MEFTGTTRHDLAGPNHIRAVSASLDPHTGYQSSEVFAIDDGSFNNVYPLWLHDSKGWHWFGGSYSNISATRDGHVYAITWGNSIRYIDSNGSFTNLFAPNAGVIKDANTHTIAASVGPGGQNEVFAIGFYDRAIYVNTSNAPGQWQLVDNHVRFSSLSATVNDTLFGLAETGAVYQETAYYFPWETVNGFHSSWTSTQISPLSVHCVDISADIDANGCDQVYALDGWYSYNYSTYFNLWTVVDYNVYDIAGADGGSFYEVFRGSSYDAYLIRPTYNGWETYTYLGSELS